ncbi:hypothetical protein Goshw_018589, partial [Gossypium schwendimanii]|nr:hypothetical protein [Gossypium schwendimanii]
MASQPFAGIADSKFFSIKKVSVLLDDSNYLLWRQQILFDVKAYKLQRFLDLHTVPPPSTVLDDNGVLQENVDFESKSTSRLMFYRRALHSQHKGDLSMREFLMKVKGFCDNLAGCREIISEHEHITVILNGLPAEYEPIVSIIVASP